ncbi:hypothetical protein PHYPO_G00132140 [Pangasianodon hypophthalmus]|uniref:Uncharacterized protein n=1 Tax=Pangasianodon hypophthalmus TaxID=310915 RepID=A0A5N5KJX4_PANHP|nr:hypothetical protein PHYPO_G00132140 [Pangasianodon hypophthalmus]
MLTPLSAFQTRLADIMETLAKAAVVEISKLVELECKILLSEVTRGQHEIDFLRKRLQLMEKHIPRSENPSSRAEDHSSRSENHSSRSENHSSRSENHSSRTENQPCIKRESELEEFGGGDAALVDTPVTTEQDHQHHGEKQTTEVKIKQEGFWDAELGGEKARDGVHSTEEISTRHFSDESADRRTFSAHPQDRSFFENNLHDPEGDLNVRTVNGPGLCSSSIDH